MLLKKSFNSWSTSSVDLRIELLNKLKDIYQSRFDEMTNAIILEMGLSTIILLQRSRHNLA